MIWGLGAPCPELVPVFLERSIALGEIGTRGSLHLLLQRLDAGGRAAGGRTAGLDRSSGARGVLVDHEAVDDLVEIVGLALGLLDRSVGFFNQCRIVLGHLVHLPDGGRDLGNGRRLLAAGARDVLDQLGAFLDRTEHVDQLLGGFCHQLAAGGDFTSRLLDQHLHFARSRRSRLSEAPHFDGHHRKALARITGTRRFNRCIQRQKVGLEGDVVDQPDDVGDLGEDDELIRSIASFDLVITSPVRLPFRRRSAPCWRPARPAWRSRRRCVLSCSIAAEVSSIAAACLVVRSARSLAPARISPVADFRPPEVCRNWPTTSERLSTTALVSALSLAKAPRYSPCIRWVRSVCASAARTSPVSLIPASTVARRSLTFLATACRS